MLSVINVINQRGLPMKFSKFVPFFMFATCCCASYLHANKYILIEKHAKAGSETDAFILELTEGHLNSNCVQIDKHCDEDYNTYKINRVIGVS